ncbi:hypothetical protein CPB83DRAFT_910654 [Crepidotus variabilis]|uniref:Zn(2)-C6 fungal-type domain-containing protein n=1 Tax=Crepidotus variabilis TaxID=179855 RepID=A0A9P6E6G6_9AGAR|nr:hypothetical protein CPB83DRAFT_910654 [Crepidotus variabilis]
MRRALPYLVTSWTGSLESATCFDTNDISNSYVDSLMETSPLNQHQSDATTIDLAAYHIFAKETLKPTSETMVEFRNKINKHRCERCSKINEPCVALEEGRGGVRCSFCSRRRLVCSWRSDILIPASILHYNISNEEARNLHQRWSEEYSQNKFNQGNSESQSTAPSDSSVKELNARHTHTHADSLVSGAYHPNVPTIQFLEPVSCTPRPKTPQPSISRELNHIGQPSVLAGPPSLARKANKLRNTFIEQAPASTQFEWIKTESNAQVQPVSRPRGRPRKHPVRKHPVKVEHAEADDAEILRPKRTPKPTPKIQLASGSTQPKVNTKRKQSDTDLPAIQEPPRKRGRPPKTTKVSITIPARSSKRLKKSVSVESAPQAASSLPAAPTTILPLLTNLPEDLGERYHALESRYVKLCDIHAQNTIKLHAKDEKIDELVKETESLRKRLDQVMGQRL